jgi:hypothetical protein
MISALVLNVDPPIAKFSSFNDDLDWQKAKKLKVGIKNTLYIIVVIHRLAYYLIKNPA